MTLKGCICGHTAKHHKRSGRCRGKVLTPKQQQGLKIAGSFRVSARLLGIPPSCLCDAAARKAKRKGLT